MCLAAAFFPVLNASVKYLGQRYPVTELFFVRYAVHCLICLALFLPRYGLGLFATTRPGVHAVRAFLLFSASAFYFLGLLTIDLPTAAAISFAGPIFVTAFSVPILREKVGPRRWTAILVGFLGALVIIRPGTAVMQWGAVLVLIDTLCYGLYQVLSRKVGGQDPAYTSITLAGLGGLLLASLFLPSTCSAPAQRHGRSPARQPRALGPARPFLRHQGLPMGTCRRGRARGLRRVDRCHASRLAPLPGIS
jgi:drug/metabolite transporter (DMT)-like permease